MIKQFLVLAVASSAISVAAPAMAQEAAASGLPMCSAKITDSCMQTPAQQKRAMTAEQAEARDARHGGMWAPNHDTTPKPAMRQRMRKVHKSEKMMMNKPPAEAAGEPKPM